jgi:hypothetical protein
VSADEQLYDSGDLAKLLAPALGMERAEQVVHTTLQQLGFPSQALHVDEALAALRLISQSDGVVGVAGRFALTRVTVGRDAVASAPRSEARLKPMTRNALVQLFVPSVGNEKANDAVSTALARLNISSQTLNAEEVGAVLGLFVDGGGILATVARFARARLLLRPSDAPGRKAR